MFLPFDLYSQFEFHLIGVNHKTAALDIREQFCINEYNTESLFEAAKLSGIDNLLVVSTCNRTELYAFTHQPEKLKKIWLQHANDATEYLLSKHAYQLSNHQAIRHLFEVTCGLDAQILGDFEILGQVKNALKKSKQYQMANGNITRLVEFAISASKAAKTQTQISSGASSIASASVVYLQRNISQLQQKKILLIGAGKIGRTACDNLTKQVSAANITVVNRTYTKALQTANDFGLHAAQYENLQLLIDIHDIVIVATGAATPVITTDTFQNITIEEKVLLDLSVPRNIDAEVSHLPGIEVVNIEQLEDIKNESLELRELSVPKAKQIIHEHILQYYAWLHTTPAFPVIEKLTSQFGKADIKNITSKLIEAGIIPSATTVFSEEKILGLCISYVKDNYYKPEIHQWYQETFQLKLQTVTST